MLNTPQSGGKHFVIIRRAHQSELEKVCELNKYLNGLNHQKFDPTIMPEWSTSAEGRQYFTDRLTDPLGLFLVAVDVDRFVGYLNANIFEGENYRIPAKCAELENMMVIPEFQHKGIGSKLIEVFFNWCRDQGIVRIKVSVYCKNTDAIAYYKHLGFQDYYMTLEMPTPPASDITISAETPAPLPPREDTAAGVPSPREEAVADAHSTAQGADEAGQDGVFK
ncbi:MAG: GNAT family N-acetyltransferase [Patescibacteria group bacterium]|nr:GNAT family N-acetyltransferase [Patescibacteria group bacterium]